MVPEFLAILMDLMGYFKRANLNEPDIEIFLDQKNFESLGESLNHFTTATVVGPNGVIKLTGADIDVKKVDSFQLLGVTFSVNRGWEPR